MRKHIVLSTLVAAVVSTMALPSALAGTTIIGIGYDDVGIHLGNGVNASVPAGELTVGHRFRDNYGVGFGLVDGVGNGLTYQHLQVSADKLLPFDGGTITPEVMIGGSRVGIAGGNVYHVSTAYAGFGASYRYPIGRYVSLDGSAAFGRDFATHVTGLSTVGGLFYQAGAAVDFSGVGPGLVSVDYEYRHLPISVSHGIHLHTSTIQAQYSIAF
ncbi:hypothetical protein NR402_12045 [Acidithiobacillus ferrooxidans]|uniref:hypothetical protein n=1 Tax=Acidithiobacillus ferrooxidans TaxID=920 RepID=UPI00214C5DC4|nr:hypothetical protein [Acidithiobacillus ferrooxidans]MCR2831006.1 hypothetical protein [Acidithiobacillus ferrooxidans]